MARILVVDDEAPVLHALKLTLCANGFEVATAASGPQALGLMHTAGPFHVLLSDYRMPGMNGAEFLERARCIDARPLRILITAYGEPRLAAEAVNQGQIYRYITKPWNTAELLAVLHQACGFYALQRRDEELQREVHLRARELQEMNLALERLVEERTASLLEGLTCALDYRDTETQWHSRRVGLYAQRLARELGIGGADLRDVERGALLHDLGKIGVRDAILLKPGKLSEDEWVEMRRHSQVGYLMLRRIPYLAGARHVVLQHHERWDGCGYPQRLRGRDIVPGARVFAVVDTLDAITSDRPYRKGRPLEVAEEEIARCSGTQFDPDVVAAFQRIPRADIEQIRFSIDALAAEEQRLGELDAGSIAAGSLRPEGLAPAA